MSEAPKLIEFRAAIKANSRKYYIVGQGKSSGVLGNRAKDSGKYTRGRWEELCAFLGGMVIRASGPTRRAKWAKKWFALAHSGSQDLVKTSR
jgi:hypothetical protein